MNRLRAGGTGALLFPILITLAGAVAAQDGEDRKSKNPPPGAPWKRDFAEARHEALKSGKALFLYSTKTY